MRASTKRSPKNISKRRAQRSSAHRLRSVQLVLGGHSAVKVGRKYGDSSRAVSIWVERFKSRGTKGLIPSSRSGRPSKLLPPQMKRVERYVAKARKESHSMSGGILASYITKTFGIKITRRQCERILKRLRASKGR